MSDNKSGAEKSLGQLAFEAYWGDLRNWDDTEPRIKVQWEIAGGSVRDAVLSRQSAIDVGKMVDRFLGWTLPKNFAPDGGIVFNKEPDALGYPRTWPVGTNVFDADQARQMIEYMLDGLPHVDLAETEKLREDAMTMALRLMGESPDTFAPETYEVMNRWRPKCLALLSSSALSADSPEGEVK